ncbi:MAG TPA: dipeptide epimerase [Povalibacter sp.]|nr:dipeptide epimerase [Povalibacter sp.]
MVAPGVVALTVELETWPLIEPFRITGHTTLELRVIVVTLRRDGYVGRGEAAGVFYRGEDVTAITRQVESVRAAVEAGIGREALRRLLPNGGARNAVDCALWDLEAKASNRPAWQVAGLEKPRALLTTFTCGADHPDRMAAAARRYTGARALKLKLTGESLDAERVQAVREARPEVWLAVDANQGFDRASLERLMPVLVAARVALIEQPFPIGREMPLDELQAPIPIAADESVQGMADLSRLIGRFNVINIKLDKCGGLTEALEMARTARRLGFDVMIGNMLGTSLAMAPAFLVGQLCSVVDLDGPVFLRTDRDVGVVYADGFISCPDALWGSPP